MTPMLDTRVHGLAVNRPLVCTDPKTGQIYETVRFKPGVIFRNFSKRAPGAGLPEYASVYTALYAGQTERMYNLPCPACVFLCFLLRICSPRMTGDAVHCCLTARLSQGPTLSSKMGAWMQLRKLN